MSAIRTDDHVRVLSGPHAGRTGVVLNVADVRTPGLVAWRLAAPVDVRLVGSFDWDCLAPDNLAPADGTAGGAS